MKRLGRWLLGGSTVISFVLFAATAGVMLRGLFVPETFSNSHYDRKSRRTIYTSYGLENGRLSFAHGVAYWPPYAAEATAWIQYRRAQGVPMLPAGNSLPGHKWIWFDRRYGMDANGVFLNDYGVAVHGVLILLVASLLPAFWVRRLIYGRRYAIGWCANCGYDLRSTPDRCPECGTVPAKQKIISDGSLRTE